MKPLGLNRGGYFGERIEIHDLLQEMTRLAGQHAWQVETLEVQDQLQLLTLHRPPRDGFPLVYISAGIHGDEPAPPVALMELLRENEWPEGMGFSMCPCLNPTGFPGNTRENGNGIDLNWDYRHQRTPEVREHVRWLDGQPHYDLALCLHEDWEAQGFYIYELNSDQRPCLAKVMLDEVSPICPVDLSPEIEGMPAERGIIRPEMNPDLRPEWPEAFYLLLKKTRWSYTVESPSDFPLRVRVDAMKAAVKAACHHPFLTRTDQEIV